MSAFRIDPGLELDRLALRVRDLDRVVTYYEEVLGFAFDGATLSLAGGRFAIDLLHEPDAPLRPYPCVGLYHFALLVPDRAALGAIFRHLAARNETLEGIADHVVSEALYLRDPEGNGIELYRDRPSAEWPLVDGQVQMTSDPLDVEGVMGAASGASTLHPDTRFGHIHLHVSDLADGERFFADRLGLGVTQRTYRGALFFAAGDYHHHVAVNTWARRADVPDGATGLVSYRFKLSPDGFAALAGHAGVAAGDEVRLTDPVGAEVIVAPSRG